MATDRILREERAEHLACRIGARRGRGIALLWHRVRPDGPYPDEAVRAVATESLVAQLEIVQELGDIVPLRELEVSKRGRRPRFALTFDDDDPGHAEHTLPLLTSRGLPATFFLSGRWRTGHGPYWWEALEQQIRAQGAATIALQYGLPPSYDAVRIAAALTGTSQAAQLTATDRSAWPPQMKASHAAALVAAGMEIGYHTLHHPSLPTLGDEELRDAVADGRAELAAELDTPIECFAYPHGHTDRRVAAAVKSAGYVSGWTTAKHAAVRGDDQMLHGRWDLGHLDLGSFRSALVRSLVRPRP